MRNKVFVSEFISFSEATYSITAVKNNIINFPNRNQLRNMRIIGLLVFDPLRAHFGYPITVTSMFRSEKLNTLIRGSSTSQHVNGEAIDLKAGEELIKLGITNKNLFDYIEDYLEFDQLIWEHGDDDNPRWIHVSYNNLDNGLHNRKQILKAVKIKGETVYSILKD